LRLAPRATPDEGVVQQLTDLITVVCPAVHNLIVNSRGLNVMEWVQAGGLLEPNQVQ
jgi:hypothetical protein